MEPEDRRHRHAGRAAADRPDGDSGSAACGRHVRRNGAGADPDGLRSQCLDPVLGPRDADLLPRGRRPGAELSRLELRLHRPGAGRNGRERRQPEPEHPPGPRRHHRGRRALFPHRPRGADGRAPLDRAADAARGHGRHRRRHRPRARADCDQQRLRRHARQRGGHQFRPLDRACHGAGGRSRRGLRARNVAPPAGADRRCRRLPDLLCLRQHPGSRPAHRFHEDRPSRLVRPADLPEPRLRRAGDLLSSLPSPSSWWPRTSGTSRRSAP